MHNPHGSPLTSLCLSLSLAWLLGCGPGPMMVSQSYARLDGRGPVLLGDGNEHMPADTFFQEQRAESSTISQFVTSHGEPAAISLDGRIFRSPRLVLYYPSENKGYLFRRGSSEWKAVGVQPIKAADREALDLQIAEAGGRLASAEAPAALPRAEVASASAPVAARVSPGEHELRGRLKAPQAAEEARLVRLPNGDYRHRVTFQGESLQLLAEWYTEDARNAAVLASANRRSPTTVLRIGDEITIPKRMMRNIQAMPEAAVS